MQYTDPPLYEINEFCARHKISRPMFFKLRKAGKGPKVVKVGRRTLIPGEYAAEWRDELKRAAG